MFLEFASWNVFYLYLGCRDFDLLHPLSFVVQLLPFVLTPSLPPPSLPHLPRHPTQSHPNVIRKDDMEPASTKRRTFGQRQRHPQDRVRKMERSKRHCVSNRSPFLLCCHLFPSPCASAVLSLFLLLFFRVSIGCPHLLTFFFRCPFLVRHGLVFLFSSFWFTFFTCFMSPFVFACPSLVPSLFLLCSLYSPKLYFNLIFEMLKNLKLLNLNCSMKHFDVLVEN